MNSKNQNSTKSNTIDDVDGFSFQVGKIVGFRGLKGELKIVPATNSLAILMEIESVKLHDSKKLGNQIKVIDVKAKGKMLFLTLDGYSDRNAVESLRNQKIYTQPVQLLELDENEWWSQDLVGLDVVDTSGNKLGIISDIFGEQGEFLEVQLDPGKEKRLIPFVKEVVPRVDINEGIIEVSPPEGLLD